MFTNKLALLVLRLAFFLLPDGYSVNLWKWPNGQGNMMVYTCPKPNPCLSEFALWKHH